MPNILFYGDNLDVLRRHIRNESVDLIYLDPPFNSNASYNVIFKKADGSVPEAQLMAFEDTWRWTLETEAVYDDIIMSGHDNLGQLLQSFRMFLGQNDMMAYLVMMAVRLKEMYVKLKPTGSLYLHCDPTACHYIKLVLDALFGPAKFRNEIVWKRTSAHNDPKRYGRNIDTILFYTKGDTWTWNQQYKKHDETYLKRFRRQDADGRYWGDWDLSAKGLSGGGYEYEYKGAKSLWRVPIETMKEFDIANKLHFTRTGGIRLKRYLDETKGVPLQSLWDDINPINSQAKERVGYATQKPVDLLSRILLTSSNEGDLVLDPFCGCGTTVAAAERLNRQWIGIDVTHLAIMKIKERLNLLQERASYVIRGLPKDLDGARELARQNKKEFQLWVLDTIGAFPGKKGADGGIDGFFKFLVGDKFIAHKALVQVKGGHTEVGDIRDLRGAMAREKAEIGVFITLEEPTGPMKAEVVAAGLCRIPVGSSGQVEVLPTIQLMTVEELFRGKRPIMPTRQPVLDKSMHNRISSAQISLFENKHDEHELTIQP